MSNPRGDVVEDDDSTIMITIVSSNMQDTETLYMPSRTTTVQDAMEMAVALFDLRNVGQEDLYFIRDGKRIRGNGNPRTLHEMGIRHGDMLAIQIERRRATRSRSPMNSQQTRRQQQQQQQQPQNRMTPTSSAPISATSGGGGGLLDFSSLLAMDGGGQQQQTATQQALSQQQTSQQQRQHESEPIYWKGMNFSEAAMNNPHPSNMVKLLMTKDHLMKELNYHNPTLAMKLRGVLDRNDDKTNGDGYASAIQIWREETVKGGIASAMRETKLYHEQRDMKQRLEQNPKDEVALEYFRQKDRKIMVHEQYQQMMEVYPESMGRVLMLYIHAKINGHPIKPFCDSGAQVTLMSKTVCKQCGLLDWVDERFAGIATGVGTGKILGRIHLVDLEIGPYHFPCTVQVMDDPKPGATEMPFLLGLDMMKRHLCQMDFKKGVLRFHVAGGIGAGAGGTTGINTKNDHGDEYYETPFLHEKDLRVEQGGTMDFDVEKANKEFMEREQLRTSRQDNDDMEEDDDNNEDANGRKTST